MKKKYSTFILYLFFFLYLELISKVLMFNKIIDFHFIYVLLFSLSASFLFYVISSLWKEKTQKIVTFIILGFITFFYIFNYLYYSLLSVPFSLSTLELAGQALDFVEIGFHLCVTKIVEILVFLIPLCSFILYQNRFKFEKIELKKSLAVLGLGVFTYGLSLVLLLFDKNDLYSAYNLYYNTDSLTTSVDVLGVLTTERLDLKRNLFGFEEKVILESENNKDEKQDISYNELDIPFDKLIENTTDEDMKESYTYLKNKSATNKNAYTGMYKGKNLIFILAEGFNSIAVSKELTPTLYRLVHEGFDFTNYYSPIFFSTTGGEFQAMTSLIPTQDILNTWRNQDISLPYALGNAFADLGYSTSSYHNWSYKYYGRNHTMALLGFPNYTACGNGLEKKINCQWLPSDIDLIETSFNDYKDNTPFVTYYITVSGHAPYNFLGGNSIALKNKDKVNEYPYSDAVKSYLASQLELEYAVANLINKLEESGLLEDTVLVLTGDHYPYTLTLDEVNELTEVTRDETVEVNHSNLIIWNPANEHQVIDKVASQIDVLPTILNLFGVEYDSRLLMGNDIFSDSEGLAIFSDHSWISNEGVYRVQEGFTSKNGETGDTNYSDEINNRVSNSFTISKAIIEKNLYQKIIDEE